MDNEIDLMLTRKSQVIETNKQEYAMPEKEFRTHQEEAAQQKMGQMVQQNYKTGTKERLSFESIGDSMKSEVGDMDLIREKGRTFMRRYEWAGKGGRI